MRKLIYLGAVFVLVLSCKPTVDLSKVDFSDPPTVIYKMKADYSKQVPVILNEEKTKMVSYPAPKDMFYPNGELRYPLVLGNDFYLDEIGIGVNTAFISLDIDQYAHMLQAPSPDSLFKLIVDKDPFDKMYNLGNRKQYEDKEVVKELFSSGKFRAYKKLK